MKFINKPVFKPRARLLLQLGDQLIKNENIAVLELVKNSYDADAKNVTVKMERVDYENGGRIEILDDGCGMDDDAIFNAWLEPGSDYKELQYRKNKRSDKYKRLPIGEKGIGRFGVHKLGNKIELITRKKDGNEFVVIIDWTEFAKKKYLDQAEIQVIERDPEYFLRSRHGTRIIITDVRTVWDRRMMRDLHRALATLSSPFHQIDHFKIDFQTDKKDWVADLIDWKEIKDYALYHFKMKISGSEITEFKYEFMPWENMDRVKSKTIDQDHLFISDHSTIEVKSAEDKRQKVIINLDKHKIGEVEFEGYIFDRDLKILGLLEESKTNQIKKYLNDQGGIRVYRDNLRVNEYGESANDWLNLDLRRVNLPTKRISNNIILSVITLKREDSSGLVEKTNREGFVENEAYNDFKAAILYGIGLVEKLRQVDKAELRERYSPNEKDEPVLHLTNELRSYVESRIKDEPIKNKVVEYIGKIEADYEEINKILLTSAGAGLTLGVGIHEIEKLVKVLVGVAKEEHVTDRVSGLIQDVQGTVNNYLGLLKQNDKEDYSVLRLLNSSLTNVEYRLKVHQVEVIRAYESYDHNLMFSCSRRFFMSAMLNVIDNSIYWLGKKGRNLDRAKQTFDKKIWIGIEKFSPTEFAIIVADNGNGFALPTSKITKPFITAKDDGMGLGLHITSQIMKVMKGRLEFPDPNDFNLPDEFKSGAVIAFVFNPVQNDTAR